MLPLFNPGLFGVIFLSGVDHKIYARIDNIISLICESKEKDQFKQETRTTNTSTGQS